LPWRQRLLVNARLKRQCLLLEETIVMRMTTPFLARRKRVAKKTRALQWRKITIVDRRATIRKVVVKANSKQPMMRQMPQQLATMKATLRKKRNRIQPLTKMKNLRKLVDQYHIL